ncbi:DEAD/DEAH box helicase family protein [Toxoplasma gondii RUB]|uniref:ATP-dependent RNA helicase, putative n=13 Tax=Toxoplasma gondii TaxID=5811 RepID=B9QP65_TOXGV|nr:DEAD/DEAH box helicase family protein [Toxoplasma gondii GT1]ESS33448.1 DEAD/DEAH box helicase family protein [Toxoplasma gondii VEG]KAF4644024.1 DEAD/DEAH box helicase family protein [Toxoplasma gondii]KFG29518.1 DEAD/DEAH box helicase family protein [Toxoplasma gondii p89]KFG39001.1 DEAD/DEAH box helicase family protein [Toxoplasma gondii GAB2-2007-GAL-DOM2]KFG42551.1 DEAD/DEAH box helicase family protein [Toxoplasma gondii FOU]KFG58999.1 DEAD/DEAH box helicase family protein [Toxoplasma
MDTALNSKTKAAGLSDPETVVKKKKRREEDVKSPAPDASACPTISASAVSPTFASLGLCSELCASVSTLGWKSPTAIQSEVLPYALQGRDIIALAETGSGKTAAFGLPILQRLLQRTQRFYALILAPTRELCLQISQQILAMGGTLGVTVVTLVGGLDHNTQAIALAKKPHVVVGSPGRVVDHLQQTKGFSLKSVKVLVLDEADRLLSLDFDAALQVLLEHVGSPAERQTMLFSATMTTKVSKLQKASLKKPVKLEVNSKYDVASHLQQHFLLVPFKLKHTHLAAALLHLSPSSVIVFTNTCANARKTALFLRHLGFQSVCLHGKMTQPQRIGALTKFRAAETSCLVATEVGSRGLDIPHVQMVINFDVPLSSKEYIHRVGRTARAGRTGRALTIVTQYDVEAYQRIEHALGQKLEELTELTATEKVMPLHEKVLEALRSAELEAREADEAALVQKAAKKKRGAGNKRSSGAGKKMKLG